MICELNFICIFLYFISFYIHSTVENCHRNCFSTCKFYVPVILLLVKLVKITAKPMRIFNKNVVSVMLDESFTVNIYIGGIKCNPKKLVFQKKRIFFQVCCWVSATFVILGDILCKVQQSLRWAAVLATTGGHRE